MLVRRTILSLIKIHHCRTDLLHAATQTNKVKLIDNCLRWITRLEMLVAVLNYKNYKLLLLLLIINFKNLAAVIPNQNSCFENVSGISIGYDNVLILMCASALSSHVRVSEVLSEKF
jgi:hypothetical protein